MNLCKDCKYFDNQADIWYSQFCKHPNSRHKKGKSPVNGKEIFIKEGTNAFGTDYKVEAQHEFKYVRDVNPSGNCQLFDNGKAKDYKWDKWLQDL